MSPSDPRPLTRNFDTEIRLALLVCVARQPGRNATIPQGDKNWWAPLRIGYAAVKQGYDFASRLLSRECHEVASEASLP